MTDRIYDILQRMGRSFMLPIALLPLAGILLGFGTTFTNELTLSLYHLEAIMGPGTVPYIFFSIIKNAGQIIFNNIAILFAIGVAIGMSKHERAVAALSAFIAYMVMNSTINALLLLNGKILEDGTAAAGTAEGTITTVCGITSLQTGVFGGIIVGLGVAWLHRRFYTVEFPQIFSFFSGTRFVPIISTLVYIGVGILLFYLWPFAQNAILLLGDLVNKTGYLGTLIFGMVKRALLPLGLHHVFYLPFWQTAVGGTMEIGGVVYEGGQNIFFAQLTDPGTVHFSENACRYFSGEPIFMIFGLPGAALAMYHCADKEHRKKVGSLLLSAALTSMVTGITEPLEFSFLFAAPALYILHVVLAGSCYMVAQMLHITIGLTFSGGVLDFFTFGILQGNDKTNWMLVIPVGLVYFCIYYVSFRFLILKFHLKTPGRETQQPEERPVVSEDVPAGEKPHPEIPVRGSAEDRLRRLIRGLGGGANIEYIDCCATRLRCTLKEIRRIDRESLDATGHSGIVLRGNSIQIIYGPQVTVLKSRIRAYLDEYENRDQPFSGEARIDLPPSGERDSLSGREPEKAGGKKPEKGRDFILIPQEIKSPVSGRVLLLCEVDDIVFSSELLGKGFAVEPADHRIYAPLDGVVSAVFDSKHAISIDGARGVQLMIHVGLNTVKLKGAFFRYSVKAGDQVKEGDLLVEFDREEIEKAGYSTVTPVIVSNTDAYHEVTDPVPGLVRVGDPVIRVR